MKIDLILSGIAVLGWGGAYYLYTKLTQAEAAIAAFTAAATAPAPKAAS